MKKPLINLALLFITFALSAAGAQASESLSAEKARLQEAYGQLPLSFEANHGQTDRQVMFLSRGPGFTLFLKPAEAVFIFRPAPTVPPRADTQQVVRMQLLRANPRALMKGVEPLPGRVNYFIGTNPQHWRTNIPTYAKVQYEAAYPGIDILYYGKQRQLEFDVIVAPGADPNVVGLSVEGADRLEVDAQGDVVLHAGSGEIQLLKPLVYQMEEGVRQEIPARYVVRNPQEVGFQLGSYDASRPLIIDPILSYSTYLGGSSSDQANSIAVDASGNAYMTGVTSSTDFPITPGAFQPAASLTPGGINSVAFVTKLNPMGSALAYSTFLGKGSAGIGIAVDSLSNAYVVGGPGDECAFPTTPGAFQTVPFDRTCPDPAPGGAASGAAFVTKLNPTGSALVYSTLLGGSGSPGVHGIAVDTSGNAYVTGLANLGFPPFPITSVTFGGNFICHGFLPCGFAFVMKLNAEGSALVYSGYLGGGSGTGIAVDASGNAYVTGATSSTDFSTTSGAFQTTLSGLLNAFVTKLDPTGFALVYSTYLGGNGTDDAKGIAVDASGNAYVTGGTGSINFPTTPGAFQTTFGPTYVTKLNPTGSALVYSTFLGTESVGTGIAVDALGNAYVTGLAGHIFPTTPGAFQTTLGGGEDAFVTILNAAGSALVYSSYLGGSNNDQGNSIAVDAFGNAYVTGVTSSTDFPTTAGAFQPACAGVAIFNLCPKDAFVTKITTVVQVAIDINPGSDLNNINPKSKGVTPVAILSTASFDAPARVNKSSLTFGRTGNENSLRSCAANGEDVNGDGLLDQVCQFFAQQTGFQAGDTLGVLKGKTVEGTPITGTDSVHIVPF